MDEIEKVKALNALKKNFQFDQDLERDLISQIVDENIRDNVDRFLDGYEIESIFSSIFSSLPWVKLLHGLEQLQFPSSSKKRFQVPDFIMLFSDGHDKIHKILIEVKGVNGDKQSLKLMNKQYEQCKAYSTSVDIPLYYAVFWRKWQVWTLNSYELFSNNSNTPKLSVFDALKYDLSSVVGDVYFPLTNKVYRRSVYDNSIVSDSVRHERFGHLVSDELSLDNSDFWSINQLESAVLDSYVKMNVIDEKVEGAIATTIEEDAGPCIFKLTTILMKHLALIGAQYSEPSNIACRAVIVGLMKKLKVAHKFLVPDVRDNTSRHLLNSLIDTY